MTSQRHVASTSAETVLQILDAERDALRERICSILDEQRVQIALQPIVELETRRIAGYEALTRIVDEPDYRPEQFFADARAAGLGAIAELVACRAAVGHLKGLPENVFLSINVSPALLTDPRLRAVLPPNDLHRLVLELTETTPIEDYPELLRSLPWLRANGLRIAVDDTGAGYASLRHVLIVSPEIIKLDSSVTAGIADDPARQAMAWALAWFARRVRAEFIAEGLETTRDVDMVYSFGVRYGQGFALGVPRLRPDADRLEGRRDDPYPTE